jgi:uncharacterized membrane protein YozB (DUF420 family)
MELLQVFPHLNAALNATSGVLLMIGFALIRSGRRDAHKLAMLSAAGISALFLVSYVAHHSVRTYYFGLGPTRFTGEGLARPIYFTILMSHTILATAVAPFVIAVLWRGLKGRFEQHKRLARLVFPVWLYVSITGVAVYIMLYHLYPAS